MAVAVTSATMMSCVNFPPGTVVGDFTRSILMLTDMQSNCDLDSSVAKRDGRWCRFLEIDDREVKFARRL